MQISELIQKYLSDYTSFNQFSTSHIWAVVIMLFCCTLVPYLAKKYLNGRQQKNLGIFLALIVLINFISWYIIIFIAGTFDIKKDLPLQICHYANILLLLIMWSKNKYWFSILYFWILAGMLQAVITPDIQADYPHYWFWRYWIVHAGPIICIIYAASVYGLRPSSSSIIKSFLVFNLVLFFTALINLGLNTNYAYLRNKPAVSSLFDFLGPWPWYIIVAEVATLLLFTLVYTPYWLIDFSKKNSITDPETPAGKSG